MSMTRSKMLAVLMMLGMGLWLSGLSEAADVKQDSKNSGDKEFVQKASASGMAGVNLSQLAVRLARDPAVKQFAQRMIADHGRATQELTQLANQRSIPLAKTMDEHHQKTFDKLKGMSGKDFDQAYMDAMVKDHEEAVKLFEQESKDGKDKAMKAWAGKLTPIFKRHLEKSRTICKQTKGEKEKSKD
jgi:putative membrane protein